MYHLLLAPPLKGQLYMLWKLENVVAAICLDSRCLDQLSLFQDSKPSQQLSNQLVMPNIT